MEGKQFLIRSHLILFTSIVLTIHLAESASIGTSDHARVKHSMSARSPGPLFPALAVVNQLREIKSSGEARLFPPDGPSAEDFVDTPPFDAGVGKIDEPGNDSDYNCGPMPCGPESLNPERIGNSPLPADLGPPPQEHELGARPPFPMQITPTSKPRPETSSLPTTTTTAFSPNETQTSASSTEVSTSLPTTPSSLPQVASTEQSTTEQDMSLLSTSTSAVVGEAVTSTAIPTILLSSESPSTTSANSQTESTTEPKTASPMHNESSTEEPVSDERPTLNSSNSIFEEVTTASSATTTGSHVQKDSADISGSANSGNVKNEALSKTTTDIISSSNINLDAAPTTAPVNGENLISTPSSPEEVTSIPNTASTSSTSSVSEASTPSATVLEKVKSNAENLSSTSAENSTASVTMDTTPTSGEDILGEKTSTPSFEAAAASSTDSSPTLNASSDSTTLPISTATEIDSDSGTEDSVSSSSAPTTVENVEEETTEEEWSSTTELEYETDEEASTESQNYDYEANTSAPDSEEASESDEGSGDGEEEFGDITTESYDEITTLKPEMTVLQRQKLSNQNSQANLSFIDRECKFEDSEKFKRNIQTATFGYNLKSEPTLLTFVDESPCVASFSDSGHDEIMSIRKLWPTLKRRLSVDAAGFADGCIYFVESGVGAKPQVVQRFNYNADTKAYKESSGPISTFEFLRSVCGIQANQSFRIRSFLKLPNSSTCFVFNETGRNALVSPNATSTELSLAHSIEHLLQTEYINYVEAIFVWADEPSLSIVYVYGSNGELYVVHRNMMRNSPEFGLWKPGNYALIPYEQFPA